MFKANQNELNVRKIPLKFNLNLKHSFSGSSPPKLQKSTSGSRLTGPNPVQRTPSLSSQPRTQTPTWSLRTRASSPGSPFISQSPRTDTGQKGKLNFGIFSSLFVNTEWTLMDYQRNVMRLFSFIMLLKKT